MQLKNLLQQANVALSIYLFLKYPKAAHDIHFQNLNNLTLG